MSGVCVCYNMWCRNKQRRLNELFLFFHTPLYFYPLVFVFVSLCAAHYGVYLYIPSSRDHRLHTACNNIVYDIVGGQENRRVFCIVATRRKNKKIVQAYNNTRRERE